MQIKIFIDKENKKDKVELKDNSSVKELLEKLDINPTTVIVSKNNELVLGDEILIEKDDIKIMSVISGG